MENVCKKCGNNLYGNRIKCPFCGTPIGSRNPYNDAPPKQNSNFAKPASRPSTPTTNPLSGMEIIVLLIISFFIPPLGIVFFFGFNKEQRGFAVVALVAGILGFIMYT